MATAERRSMLVIPQSLHELALTDDKVPLTYAKVLTRSSAAAAEVRFGGYHGRPTRALAGQTRYRDGRMRAERNRADAHHAAVAFIDAAPLGARERRPAQGSGDRDHRRAPGRQRAGAALSHRWRGRPAF